MTYKHTTKLTPQQRAAWAQARAAQKRTIAANKVTPGNTALSANTKQIQKTNAVLRGAETVGDLTADVLTGALKALEGVYDLGAGVVGAVGGIFSDDFQDDVKDHISYDAMGTWVGDPLDSLFDDSYLNDSKAGQITEAVAQGVGQMLPAVAVSIITGGATSSHLAAQGTATAAQISAAAAKAGQMAALATTAASAAGTGTEEAFQEGAGYGEGLAYGALTGAVEAGTEKLTGGLTKGLYGAGVLDKLGKSVAKEGAEGAVKAGAKVGAQRVIKGMVEEGAEEALAELASPTLKSIYKGKDAFKEYGEGEYWSGVGESALVGGLTSAVYGGTVGKIRKLGGASGIENDASAVLDDINERKKQVRNLAAKGKLTREQAINIEKTIKADMELLEKQLQKASDKSRAKALEGSLSVNFDENGNLRPEIREILDKNIAAATDTTYDHRYRSIDLDADTITETLERTGTTAFSGEMDAEQKANFNEFTRMFNAASDKSGGSMRFVVTNEMPNDNALWVNDKGIMMISADTLRSGNATTKLAEKLIADTFIESTVHEGKHAIDGTASSSLLDEHLMSNDDVYSKAIGEYLARGYSEKYLGEDRAKAADTLADIVERGRTGKELSADERAVFEEFESEWPAFASQQVLGTEEFVRHLVKNDLSTVEKILGAIQDIKKMLKNRNNPDAKKAADFVKKAEQLYIDALEEIGAKYVNNKVIGANDEEEEEEKDVDFASQISYNKKKTAKYISYGKVGKENIEYIEAALTKIYKNVSNGIADGIGIEKGNKIYIIDSGKEKGKISFGVRGIRTISDEKIRVETLRRINNDAVSKGYISDGLSSKFRDGYDYNIKRSMRRNIGSELSTDKGKSSDKQERLLENNEYNRRVNDSYKKSKTDSDYFDAVNRGDMKAAQKAVEDAAKAAGYDKKMFHETNAENIHIFDVSRGTHGGTDSETPYGIFTKTTDKNIGLGNKQMALYVKANRTLYVADRSEVKSKIPELIDYYDEIAKIDKEYDALANKLEDAEFDALGEWMDEHPDADMDEVYPTSYIAHDMPADIDFQKYLDAFNKRKQNSEEWKNEYNKVAVKCKEIITAYLKANNYDSMYFQIDGGSRGRQTDSLILLDPEQVKSAETITYDDNGDIIPLSERFNNAKKDIRYSHKASSDSDRVTITKGALAKLKANYEGEKVFNKKDISAALEKIDALKVLSKSERDSLVSKLFEGYNIRLDAEHYEQFSEIMYNKIRARILQESDFEFSVEETSIMDEQIVKALNDIVASGKQSTRAKLEYSVSQDGLKKQADYWRSEYNRASDQIKIRGRILSIAHKIKDLKTGAYVNAAQYKSDIFKHTIEQLGRIEFRGNMNNAGTRAIIKNLNEWYDDKNNSLYKGADANTGTVGRFNNEIKQMMSAIADGDGAFTTQELLTIEKILSYFVGEIQDYNTILRNGKRVDAKPIAERHIKTAEEAQALKIKCGAIRAISRSPFAVMVADPATLMRQADGYMNGFFTEMFDEMRQGEIKAAVAEMELTNEFREFWKKNKAYGKRYNKDTVNVNGVDIPLRHAISLYMTYQRKQAQAGLVYSGFDILDGDKKITVYKGTDQKLDEKQIAEISKKRANELKTQFNEKDLELVSVMERAFEECRKLKIEVDMALQHYTNVDKSGYYFPIRRSQIAQNIDMFSIFEGDRVSNLSMNKDLVKGAKNALLIEPVDIVFMRHIKATSLYSGLGVFTDNFNRLYNLNVNAVEKELSFEVENDVKKSFGFNSINDYVGVQKAVISTLSSEGFFDNNVIVNKDSGMEIEITKDGIKETLGPSTRFETLPKAVKELKLQTLRALPAIIENGKLQDDNVANKHSDKSKLKYAYLSQDITITENGRTSHYTITVSVRKSIEKNKFWIHEIRTTEKEHGLSSSRDITSVTGVIKTHAPKSIVSLDGVFVNSKSENSDYNRPKTIKSTLESDKFTKTMAEYFTEIKKDIEGISTKEQSTKFFNDAVGFIRSAYAKYQLGANPKVWFTQLSSFFAATNILDHNSIIKGLGVKNKASDVDKYCKLAWLRNVDNTAVKAQSVTDKIGKVGDVLTAPIGWMDRGVVTSLFGACQIQVQKDQKLAVGTEENKRAAGELLQKVILETQQNSLASERSAMMRSSDNLKKSFTMFSADSMKIFSRTVDAFGEREVLRTLIKNGTDTKKKAEYEARLKKVNKACVRSVSALVTTSIFVAAIARGFKWWYRRDDEEDAWTFISDVFGNMLGGLPVIRDVYSYFADGYEMDNFLISTFNDVLKASLETWELASDVINGKDVSQQEIAGSVRKMLYASGQVLGIPTRNIYNFTTGNINRFFPATGYEIENMFYKQAYRADLAKAIENGDERMISTIAGLMLNENVGGIESKAARTELDRLIGAGFDVIPRGISDTITYDGETYELTAKQKKAFSAVYEIANDALGDMVKLARYNEASDEVKVSAIKYIYNTYYNLALQDFLGEDLETKTVLFAEAIDIEKLALIIATAQSIVADTDDNGKTVSGSKKRKIQAYINSLSLKAAEKYMIMGYLGYKNIKGEAQVKAHINTLNLTKQEKSRLLEYSGYSAA